jgi:hypothetical protein
MAISKIKTGSIEDGTLVTADLADSSITSAKIAANPEFSGTEAAKMPNGTTGQRANAASGDIRFNTTISLMEYYDGTNWKAIDAPPIIASISPTYFSAVADVITISGTNFQSGCTVAVKDKNGTSYSAASVTFVNAAQITFPITSAMAAAADDPFDVIVSNPSGLAATLIGGLQQTTNPTFATASGSIGTIYDSARGSYSLSPVTATAAESDVTISYAVTTGALPTGLSLNSSTGVITGTASSVGSDTTSTFTVTASGTDSSSSVVLTASRSFSIAVKAPSIVLFTATGSSSWTVPTGLSAVQILMVAGGGGGGSRFGAGGGAGGMIEMPSFPVTPAGSVSYTVGTGGAGGPWPGNPGSGAPGVVGSDSVFGTLTAKGGGSGADESQNGIRPGGSGGGTSYNLDTPVGGTATQPSQPGNSGTYGYGYPGGGSTPTPRSNGGGGGAGGAGARGNAVTGYSGAGGAGRSSSISGSSVTYAGGGGGSGNTADTPAPNTAIAGAGGSGGGGAGGDFPTAGQGYPINGGNGTTNRGSGGGGGAYNGGPSGNGGNGGPGIIIVKY